MTGCMSLGHKTKRPKGHLAEIIVGQLTIQVKSKLSVNLINLTADNRCMYFIRKFRYLVFSTISLFSLNVNRPQDIQQNFRPNVPLAFFFCGQVTYSHDDLNLIQFYSIIVWFKKAQMHAGHQEPGPVRFVLGLRHGDTYRIPEMCENQKTRDFKVRQVKPHNAFTRLMSMNLKWTATDRLHLRAILQRVRRWRSSRPLVLPVQISRTVEIIRLSIQKRIAWAWFPVPISK